MDWSHFWSAVQLWTMIAFFGATAAFVVIILAGFVVVVTPPLVDYIIRKMGGLKGLAGFFGWGIGVSLSMLGATSIGMSLFVALLTLIAHGTIVPGDPSALFALLAVGVVCTLLGGGLYWLFKGFSPFVPRAKPKKEVIAQKWEEVTRWSHQWGWAAGITLMTAAFLPAVFTLPDWLALLTSVTGRL
jgi:hypothetical protein